MSSISLDRLISQFPEEIDAIKRLTTYINLCKESGPEIRELTVQRLFDHAKPSSQRVLAKILFKLTEHGVFEKFLRIESDALGGIGDYGSVEEIPLEIFDNRLGREIEVRLDQVRLMYRLSRGSEIA